MATATATFTRDKTKLDVSERYVTIFGTVAIQAAAATYATAGLTLDLSGGVLSNDIPENVRIYDNPASGWLYTFSTGSTLKNGKVMIFGVTPSDATVGVLPLSEYTNGAAIPAAVSGASIKISFKLRKGR